jgi:hypothetical protein
MVFFLMGEAKIGEGETVVGVADGIVKGRRRGAGSSLIVM